MKEEVCNVYNLLSFQSSPWTKESWRVTEWTADWSSFTEQKAEMAQIVSVSSYSDYVLMFFLQP